MSLTREQAGHLAAIIRTIRPSWDELATINALGHVRDRDLADIAMAAIRTARSDDAKTPKAITFTDTDAWKRTTTETYRSPRATEQCRIDGHSGWAHRCAQCRSEAIAAKEPA